MTATPRTAAWDATDNTQESQMPGLCLNCGEPLGGAFCVACGQRAVPSRPTMRELLGEAFAEFSGWDGKLASTLRLLVARPGQLTLEFLDRRRVRYISPLRLYFSVSVLYFLLSAAAPPSSAPERVAAARNQLAIGNTVIAYGARPAAGDSLATDREAILAGIASAPAPFRPALRRLATDPKGFQADFIAVMPRLMFALLPVLAVILAVFYRGRRFVEHLYFSIHLQTFFFIALGLGVLARFSHAIVLQVAASVVALIWVPIYTHRAALLAS